MRFIRPFRFKFVDAIRYWRSRKYVAAPLAAGLYGLLGLPATSLQSLGLPVSTVADCSTPVPVHEMTTLAPDLTVGLNRNAGAPGTSRK